MNTTERRIVRILKKVGDWVTTSEVVKLLPMVKEYTLRTRLMDLKKKGVLDQRKRRGGQVGQLDSLWRLSK